MRLPVDERLISRLQLIGTAIVVSVLVIGLGFFFIRQITRVFQNLIGNAIKYRAPDLVPKVLVDCTRLDAGWEFQVSDNGIGIEPQYFDRIFGIFQRLHTRDKYEGTGIGLAICKKIIERHDGLISVESQPGTGTVFRFVLPVAKSF